MQIQTFKEMEQRVWDAIKRPCIAVYEIPDDPVPYLVKVYDADAYTGIFLRASTFDWIKKDIEENAPRFEQVPRGSEDEQSLICVYV